MSLPVSIFLKNSFLKIVNASQNSLFTSFACRFSGILSFECKIFGTSGCSNKNGLPGPLYGTTVCSFCTTATVKLRYREQYYVTNPKLDLDISEQAKDIEEEGQFKGVISKVNEELQTDPGRLFAVVHLTGRQVILKNYDLITAIGHFPPDIGERIVLEKVLMVGSANFSLLGRPLLTKEQVRVEATVVEKTLSQVLWTFYMIKGGQFKKTKFSRYPITVLRVNSIDVAPDALTDS